MISAFRCGGGCLPNTATSGTRSHRCLFWPSCDPHRVSSCIHFGYLWSSRCVLGTCFIYMFKRVYCAASFLSCTVLGFSIAWHPLLHVHPHVHRCLLILMARTTSSGSLFSFYAATTRSPSALMIRSLKKNWKSGLFLPLRVGSLI